jgi:hypothetical protein
MNMPTLVTVSEVVFGTEPYEVYLCISGGGPCYYINVINDSNLPYDFSVPLPIQGQPGYCLKVIDGANCELISCFTVS